MTSMALAQRDPAPTRLGALDALVCLNATMALYAIVQVPPIPIVPALYLAPAALLVADVPMRRAFGTLTRSRPLQWLSALIALRMALTLTFNPLTYSTFSEVGRYVAAWLGFISVALYAMSAPDRFQRLAWALVIAGGASALWFLLEVAGIAPFTLWRQTLYADIYRGADESLAETIRSGLTPYRHQMGYHLAAFVPLACAVVAGERATGRARVMAASLVAIGLLAVVASLQRSSLIAVVIALFTFAITSGRARVLTSILTASVIAAAVIAAVGLQLQPQLAEAAEASLFDKFQNEEQQLDSKFRMQLQGRALELMVEHPLGLVADGADWNEVGFRHTYEQLKAAPSFYTRPFAVHNGYLVDAVQYGLAFFLLTLGLLWSIGVVVWRVLRDWRVAPASASGLMLGTAAAVVGTLSFQTLTHNASLTSMEPASVWLLALLIAADAHCVAGRRRALAAHTSTNGGGR